MVTYFWKVKNMDKDKKENFKMEIAKKVLVFAAIQYAYHWYLAHQQLTLWNCVFPGVKLQFSPVFPRLEWQT